MGQEPASAFVALWAFLGVDRGKWLLKFLCGPLDQGGNDDE
jgi:hypothetical protein